MGFTIGSKTELKQQPEKKRVVDQSSLQTGYIEVSANASYSLTTGR